MGKIEKSDKSAEKSQVHPGYLVVDRLEDVWDANLLDFDPAAVGKPNMSKAELNTLIRALKKVRKALRLSIKEVAALR